MKLETFETKIFLTFSLISFIFALSSCNGNKQIFPQLTDSDTSEAWTEEVVDSLSLLYLTEEGVGPIKIGDEIDEMPRALRNLYDTIHRGSTTDQAKVSQFLLGSEPMFAAMDFMEGKADLIYLTGSRIKVMTPDGPIGIGDDFRKVLSLPGVELEWVGDDDHNNHGLWYWRWNGLWFGVNQERLTPSLLDKLYSSEVAPNRADFNSKVRIGYIGTGLPF